MSNLIRGISENGGVVFCGVDSTEIVRKAHKVIMLMSSDKVGRNLPYTFARMEDIDVLICEQEPEPDVMAAARQGGVTVL